MFKQQLCFVLSDYNRDLKAYPSVILNQKGAPY
jgi:hypothetical protein